MRTAFIQNLCKLAKLDKRIWLLCGDLGYSVLEDFSKCFPDRFINVGVAEQNMMATAAGLASCNKIVFASTFAIFATGRAWDQVRNSVCYNNFNIKIVATHAGISVGPDGSSHQAVEDIGLMRVIPNINIVVPCDGPETHDALLAAVQTPGPFYIRLGRPKVPTIEKRDEFKLGKARVLADGKDATIVACGIMVQEALVAMQALAAKGIKVRLLDIHSIRPLDKDALLAAAKETGGIVVCEEHTVVGGLASSVDEVVAENYPTKVVRVGIRNRFGQSGDPSELLKEYNLKAEDIEKAVLAVLR